jgi:6-phosphofructokinase 1
VNIPFNLVTRGRKKIDVQSNFWRSVLEATGQHRYFNGENGKDKK